jgi:hypothetical protein
VSGKKDVTRIGDWTISGTMDKTRAVFGEEGLTVIDIFRAHPTNDIGSDSFSVECHDGAMIPELVLLEMLRRRGLNISSR